MLLPAPQALAQTTCFTDHTGSTLCSSPGGVIQGNTNSIGNSIFRDSSGNRLDYDSDTTGKSSLQLPSGESIRWYEPVPEQPGVPQLIELRKRSPAGMDAVIPGNAPLAPVPEFPAPP
jgi:hypothetical protein